MKQKQDIKNTPKRNKTGKWNGIYFLAAVVLLYFGLAFFQPENIQKSITMSKNMLIHILPVLLLIVCLMGDKGPRYLLQGHGDQEFIRMNSNAHLGLSRHPALVRAEEEAARLYGTGPGAVRFISGTFKPHVQLEKRLAEFHAHEAAMIFSSAYATIMEVLPLLIDSETAVISDAFNHNYIINIELECPSKNGRFWFRMRPKQ